MPDMGVAIRQDISSPESSVLINYEGAGRLPRLKVF